MFDWEERRKEINSNLPSTLGILSYDTAITEIISQEKLMIEQAKKEAYEQYEAIIKENENACLECKSNEDRKKLKKEAREEFAEKIKNFIDKL